MDNGEEESRMDKVSAFFTWIDWQRLIICVETLPEPRTLPTEI